MDLIGETVGHIRIRRLIGEGGMGAVYAGFDEKLRREVAVKAIRADRVDGETRARLLREARLLSQLDHPNICRIHDYLEGESSDYLVLELIRGEELRRALDEGLDPALKLRIAEQVARTLAAAHAKGIIHRDLKPANVMLTTEVEGPGVGVKVLDFGLARSEQPNPGEWQTGDFAPIDEAEASLLWSERASGRSSGEPAAVARAVERSRLQSVLGTVSSMSPEQARGEPATAASDAYSLGLLLQELFTGRAPYESGLSHELLLIKAAEGDTLPASGAGPDLATLINRLKSLAPEARPTAVEAAERLGWIRRRPQRRLGWIAATAAAAVIVLGGLGYTLDLRWQRDRAVAAQVQAEAARRAAEQIVAGAADALEETLESRRHAFGSEHPEVARSHQDLARLYQRTGDRDQAKRHYRRALEILLARGLLAEARPIADKLVAEGWSDPEMLELCREHGLRLSS